MNNPHHNEEIKARRQEIMIRLFTRLSVGYQQKTLNAVAALGYDDISLAHNQLFINLESQGNSITTLAQRAGMTKQAMGKLVKEAQSKGYVTREQNPQDGRAQIIKLTERGYGFLYGALDILEGYNQHFLQKLGPEDYTKFQSFLQELADELDDGNF